MATDCQMWSYCCRNSLSSCRTVVFRFSRKVDVFASWRFSTLLKASRRILDCSSMYSSDRVELASSICRRLLTDLKNDSCVVGLGGGCCTTVVALIDSVDVSFSAFSEPDAGAVQFSCWPLLERASASADVTAVGVTELDRSS